MSYRSQFCIALSLLVASCSSGGGGGGGGGGVATPDSTPEVEPNDDHLTATPVALGLAATGSAVTAGDVDYFQFDLTQGTIISIELRATRLDQTAWDTAGNLPRLTLYDVDGTTKLAEHDYSGNFSDGWGWGAQDLDIPMFEVPATDTYFVSVTQDDQLTDGGNYALYLHVISVPNLQEEAEPFATAGVNDTFGTAEAILPGTVHGYHVADEDDFYSISVAGPAIVHLELTAYRNGANREDLQYYDPYLYLYDSTGLNVLLEDDDAFYWDSGLDYRFTVPAASTYYVRVYQYASAPGGPNGEYFLTYSVDSTAPTAETEPNDDTASADTIAYGGSVSGDMDAGEVDFYRFTGTYGDMIRLQRFDFDLEQGAADNVIVTLLEDDGVTPVPTGGEGVLQVQSTILQRSGTYYISVEPDGSPTATTYALRLTRFLSSPSESENNGTTGSADALVTRAAGVIDAPGDEDVYRFTLTANHLATIACYASSSPPGDDGAFEYSGHGSDLVPLLEVLDSGGTVVASSIGLPPVGYYANGVADALPSCSVSGVPSTGGTYYVRVSDASGSGGPTYYYVIEKR